MPVRPSRRGPAQPRRRGSSPGPGSALGPGAGGAARSCGRDEDGDPGRGRPCAGRGVVVPREVEVVSAPVAGVAVVADPAERWARVILGGLGPAGKRVDLVPTAAGAGDEVDGGRTVAGGPFYGAAETTALLRHQFAASMARIRSPQARLAGKPPEAIARRTDRTSISRRSAMSCGRKTARGSRSSNGVAEGGDIAASRAMSQRPRKYPLSILERVAPGVRRGPDGTQTGPNDASCSR